jgi:hypothetical protein
MTRHTEEWARVGTRAEAGPLEDFIEFHQAGSPAVGHYVCVACGTAVTIVGRLPSCRGCGGLLWESPETSPFAGRPTTAALAEEAWQEENVESAARLVRGVRYALAGGVFFWLVMAVGAYYVTRAL